MGKDLTEVRSLHRPLVPDGVGPGQHEPTFLQAIATKAKACQQHRFQDLYRYLDAEFLRHCWGDLNQDAASGVDGVTAAEYAKDLQANLQGLAERLKTKRYRAQRVRRVYIPKDNGTERPLGIPALEDKLVQLACAKLLIAIYEQDLPAVMGTDQDVAHWMRCGSSPSTCNMGSMGMSWRPTSKASSIISTTTGCWRCSRSASTTGPFWD
jgi:hypothetical protein